MREHGIDGSPAAILPYDPAYPIYQIYHTTNPTTHCLIALTDRAHHRLPPALCPQPALGNHDIWRQGSGHKFHPYNHRYPTPQTGRLEDVLDSGRENNTVNGYYSFPVGAAGAGLACRGCSGHRTSPLMHCPCSISHACWDVHRVWEAKYVTGLIHS